MILSWKNLKYDFFYHYWIQNGSLNGFLFCCKNGASFKFQKKNDILRKLFFSRMWDCTSKLMQYSKRNMSFKNLQNIKMNFSESLIKYLIVVFCYHVQKFVCRSEISVELLKSFWFHLCSRMKPCITFFLWKIQFFWYTHMKSQFTYSLTLSFE